MNALRTPRVLPFRRHPVIGQPHSSSLDVDPSGLVERIEGPHGMTSRVYLQHAALCRVAVNQRRIREMR